MIPEENKSVDLGSLCGMHSLDAVDRFSEYIQGWSGSYENCQVMRFRLDGVVYTAIEDPKDGYRSALENIYISHDPMTNVFPKITVFIQYRKQEKGRTDDVLECVDVRNGKTVLEVGTARTDDYYPCFVNNFYPENMSLND